MSAQDTIYDRLLKDYDDKDVRQQLVTIEKLWYYLNEVKNISGGGGGGVQSVTGTWVNNIDPENPAIEAVILFTSRADWESFNSTADFNNYSLGTKFVIIAPNDLYLFNNSSTAVEYAEITVINDGANNILSPYYYVYTTNKGELVKAVWKDLTVGGIFNIDDALYTNVMVQNASFISVLPYFPIGTSIRIVGDDPMPAFIDYVITDVIIDSFGNKALNTKCEIYTTTDCPLGQGSKMFSGYYDPAVGYAAWDMMPITIDNFQSDKYLKIDKFNFQIIDSGTFVGGTSFPTIAAGAFTISQIILTVQSDKLGNLFIPYEGTAILDSSGITWEIPCAYKYTSNDFVGYYQVEYSLSQMSTDPPTFQRLFSPNPMSPSSARISDGVYTFDLGIIPNSIYPHIATSYDNAYFAAYWNGSGSGVITVLTGAIGSPSDSYLSNTALSILIIL